MAIASWVGVGLFISMIQTLRADYVAFVRQRQSLSEQDSRALQVHTHVQATTASRVQLDSLMTVDPASLADTLTAAGKSAGVAIKISDALSESAVTTSGKPASSAFGFVAMSQGSFAAVMYAAHILETLPIPSVIREIQLVRSVNTVGAPTNTLIWKMNAHIRVLTVPTPSL